MAARLGLRHNTQMPSTTHTRSLLLSMFTTVALTPVERVGSGTCWDRQNRETVPPLLPQATSLQNRHRKALVSAAQEAWQRNEFGVLEVVPTDSE